VVADPGEAHDLAGERSDVVAQLTNQLAAKRSATGIPDLDAETHGRPAPELDPQTQERLRELGYVE
jgi:hypothetical protein